MREELTLRELPLHYAGERETLEAFLARHGLTPEADVETAFGIFDESERLVGCGCAAGNLLKCFAVDEELRGENALGSLVSALVQQRFRQGIYDLFVITRTYNLPLFTACGFYEVAHTETLAMLQNDPDGIRRFTASLRRAEDAGKVIGAVVMNANPFTNGHLALAEYAAAHCEVLHLFVVEEDRSVFSTETRLRLVQQGVAHLPNVRVHLSGKYILSAATFPTYFLKAGEDAAALQTELDITLFGSRIAPALGITKRFAGAEPSDPTTARYNRAMRELLPRYGVEFCEIPRAVCGDSPISASRVRALWQADRHDPRLKELVPPTTLAQLED